MAQDLFAPPTPEELELTKMPVGQPMAEPVDLFAPPTADEVRTSAEPLPEGMGAQGSDKSGQPGESDSKLEQFLRGIPRGAKETIAASSVTEEEAKASRTMPEVAGEVLGGIGIDIAAAALATKAGAVAGSFVPGVGNAIGALVGLVGYGIYAGISQETLAEKRGAGFSKGRATARAALSINPMLRWGGRLSRTMTTAAPKLAKIAKATEKVGSRVVRTGTQAAGEVALSASEFGFEKDRLMFTAAISLGLHGLAFKSGREITPVTSKVLGKAAASEAGVEAGVKASIRLDDLSPAERKFMPEKMTDDFARYVHRAGDKTSGGLKVKNKSKMKAMSSLKRLTSEERDGVYQDYLLSKFMGDELSKASDNLTSEFVKRGSVKTDLQSTEDYKSRWFDGQAVASEMDRTAGTGTTQLLNEMAEARGMFENISPSLLQLGIKAQKLTKKAGVSNKQMGQLRAFLSEGQNPKHLKGIEKFVDADGNVGGKVKDAVDAWSEAFDHGYDILKTQGFRPGYQKTYMPRQMLNMNEKVSRIEDYTSNILQMAGKVKNPKIRQWKVEDLVAAKMKEGDAINLIEQISDLSRINRHLGGSKGMTAADLGSLKSRALSSKNTYRMGNDVSAVFSKGDDFSDAFREFDISRTFLGYVHGSVKSAMMSKVTRRAYGQFEAFQTAGMPKTAKWWGNLLQDLSGDTRGELRQSMLDKGNRIKYEIHRGMQKSEKGLTETMGWNTANLAMDALTGWQTAIYPAFLGLNAKATIRNLGQNLMQTAPYLGGSYGIQAVAKATVGSNFWKHAERLKKAGILAKGFKAEALSSDSTKVGRAVGSIGDKSMKFYEASDKMNRLISYNVGHVMANDLSRNSSDAIRALEKMGPGIRISLKKAGLTSVEAFKKDQDKLGDILGKHLVGRTQFHYGNEQKAEFLREMGPMFSMFTKWPVSIASDMNTIWRENPKKHKMAIRMFERYAAPLMAVSAIHSQVEGDNVAYNALIGDMNSWAPVLSVVDASILNNPMIGTVLGSPKLMKEVLIDRDPKKIEARLKAVVRELMKSSTPVASSLLNEADRWRKAKKKKSVSQEMVDDLFD